MTVELIPVDQLAEVAFNKANPDDLVYIDTADQKDRGQKRKDLLALETGLIHNAQLAFNSTSIVNVGLAGADSIAKDSTGDYNLKFNGLKTADLSLAGVGGLDTGAEAASTWYAVHIIGSTKGTEVIDVILSLSATTPTFPAGSDYDINRRVGWVFNNAASNIRDFIQSGAGRDKLYIWNETQANLAVLIGGGAIAFTAVPLVTHVPPTSEDVLMVYLFDGVAVSPLFRVRPTGSTVATPLPTITLGSSAGAGWSNQFFVKCDSAQSIDYITNVGGNSVTLLVNGFEDKL